MTTHVYIGLYKNTPHRKYAGIWHWNITVAASLTDRADVYSVVEDENETWQTAHRTRADNSGVYLLKSNNLYALVKLPSLTVAPEEIDEFLQRQSPLQGTTPIVTGRGEWSCAQWVIRALQDMDSKGWFSETPTKLADRTAFYEYVRTSKGAMCEMALDNGVTWEDHVGVLVNGVRVLRL
ncbi:hypothetical protein CYLTODRAFT_488202 [Cylindrobasidium torrendii FP15055 ss-10]|uniref:Uncharacterized protein n=1 Tax=Cylindrobasidium torrendii FP15055 ss-10 TaxID=1314674 RepID=A0A0D7BIJ7_9AGAR|nr:hypothetical protein CYLTODRAFT_488202 [Cylindrobasidium torrendii FP15055 ss-10]